MAYAIARDYYLPGADLDDLRQEALVAVLAAIRDWRPELCPLSTFVRLVVRRRVVTAIKAASCEKHRPLSDSLRVGVDEDRGLVPIVDLLPGGSDPVELAIAREEIAAMVRAVSTLSPLERHWMIYVMNGGHLPGGANRIKVAENAVERARRKFRRAAA